MTQYYWLSVALVPFALRQLMLVATRTDALGELRESKSFTESPHNTSAVLGGTPFLPSKVFCCIGAGIGKDVHRLASPAQCTVLSP